jgi:hypothetical protein
MRSLLASILLLFSVACATTTSDLALRRERLNGHRVRTEVPIPQLVQQDDLVFLRDAAVFSAAVYDRGEPLPATPGWTPVQDVPKLPPISGRLETPHFTYRVWVNETTSPATAMIVFRGTAIPLDWYSNLRWITAAIPRVEDHYDQTVAVTQKIVDDIRARYGKDTVIISAGHSLGGGLAQTAAYSTCGAIRTVFAFDSSPVTKHRVMNRCDEGASAKTFYRVFEGSEALSYARFWIRLALGLRETDPKFVEIKVRLFDARGIRAHSMQKLAVAIDKAVHAPVQGAGGM